MNTKGKILIVDDEDTFRKITSLFLSQKGYSVKAVDNGVTALENLKETSYDILMTDLKMEPMNGFQLMEKALIVSPETIIMVITAYATIETAIEAIKRGAYDYISKPCSNEEIFIKINRALEKKQTDQELHILKNELVERYQFHNIISKDKVMQNIFRHISQIADTDTTVLICGETGTGKEMVARAIHFNSSRKNKPFIAVNCAALTETLLESELFGHEKGSFTGAFKQKLGRFELANGGTLFIDEVGDIPLVIQVKLLRAIEEKAFVRVGGTQLISTDVRIISSTNRNLEELITQGKFREDLYYRLNVFPIKLPPLRERKEDIPLLAKHFLKTYAEKSVKEINDISPSAIATLMQYDWPGNIRELENIIERSLLLETGTILNTVFLPGRIEENIRIQSLLSQSNRGSLSHKDYIKSIISIAEIEYIINLLKKNEGNIQNAAKEARINRKTLYRKTIEYGIKKEDFKKKE